MNEIALLEGGDGETYYSRFESFSITNISFLSKNTLILIFMYLSVQIGNFFGVNDMSIYIFLKGITQLICTGYFVNSISKIYGRNVSIFTLIILLLDRSV